MKNRSRLLLYFFLVFTTFSLYGAKSLSYEEAKLRSGLLIVRTTEYYIVCNGVLDSRRVVKSNLHCTYGEHEFVGRDMILSKLSGDDVEDAIFVIGMSQIKIPNDDFEYENLMSLTSNVTRVQRKDIKRLKRGDITINDDIAEFRLADNVVYNNGRYPEKVAIKTPSKGRLVLLGYIEDSGYMVRVEERVNATTSKYGGYSYKMSHRNTIKTSGAPLYYQKGDQLFLSGLHNGSGLNDPYQKHGVKLGQDT